MDYEKKYKDALERAKAYQGLRSEMEIIFPELKESEGKDEKIRKALIRAFKSLNTIKVWNGIERTDIIDWLEKQGEHANFRNKIQIGDKVTRNEDGVLVNLSQLNRVAKKQGEQKHADNAEPKFHKGDWVVYCNDDVDLITGIEENGYCINNSGYIPFVCASDVRLWAIEDAKDGDVLVSESTCGLGSWYCIFKSLDGDESMTVYCYLTRDGRFETKKELCFDKDPYNTKPATKEQRDLLFQKMHEAGYKWDAEKKELKNVEQKPAAWSEEDEKQARQIERIVHDDGCTQKLQKQIADWLKSLKDRYTWKPSDEQIMALRFVLNHIPYDSHKEEISGLLEQLKKLREE